MKITALQEYGMRCLIQLAEHDGQSPLSITSIARVEGLSTDYVGKILTHLRRSGLIKSVRGLKGGYLLSKSPNQISVGKAIAVLREKPVQPNRLKSDLCKQFPGNEKRCVHLRCCNIRQLWSLVLLNIIFQLNYIYLSDLIGDEIEVGKRLVSLLKESELKSKLDRANVKSASEP